MAVDSVLLLNTIRENGSEEYLKRIPEATLTNLSQVGEAISSTKNLMDEFMNVIVCKIADTIVKSKMFKNPLAILKGQNVPLGKTIEELFINPVIPESYDNDNNKLLKTSKPDGKVAYYGLGRKDRYPITINKAQLLGAFQSQQSFSSFINQIISAMYSGDNVDEFTLTKKLLGKNIDDGHVLVIDGDLASPKNLIKSISTTSSLFTFNSTAFNGYNLVNKAALASEPLKKCQTFCPLEEQALIIRADVQTEINYEVLANTFNLSTVELKAMTIVVDDIPSEKYDIYAMLVDRSSIQIRDQIYQVDEQYIGATMSWNYWLHHWEFLYLSLFGNAVAFGKAKATS